MLPCRPLVLRRPLVLLRRQHAEVTGKQMRRLGRRVGPRVVWAGRARMQHCVEPMSMRMRPL